jgi:hypothetical protein
MADEYLDALLSADDAAPIVSGRRPGRRPWRGRGVLVLQETLRSWELEVYVARFQEVVRAIGGPPPHIFLKYDYSGSPEVDADGNEVISNPEDFPQLKKLLGRDPTAAEAESWLNGLGEQANEKWGPVLQFAYACASRAEFFAGLADRFDASITAGLPHE